MSHLCRFTYISQFENVDFDSHGHLDGYHKGFSGFNEERVWLKQRTLTIGGSTSVRLASCLTGLDFTK